MSCSLKISQTKMFMYLQSLFSGHRNNFRYFSKISDYLKNHRVFNSKPNTETKENLYVLYTVHCRNIT